MELLSVSLDSHPVKKIIVQAKRICIKIDFFILNMRLIVFNINCVMFRYIPNLIWSICILSPSLIVEYEDLFLIKRIPRGSPRGQEESVKTNKFS
jgi:hypothetical protein